MSPHSPSKGFIPRDIVHDMSSFFESRTPSFSSTLAKHPEAPVPERKALHVRSPSHLNVPNPTVRVVEDDSSPPLLYSKSPFPRLSSHVLHPSTSSHRRTTSKHLHQHPGHVSDSTPTHSPSPAELHPPASSPSKLMLLPMVDRASTASNLSNSDTLIDDSIFSPISSRFSQGTTLRGTPTITLYETDEYQEQAQPGGLAVLQEDSLERTTIRLVSPSLDSSSDQDLRSKASFATYKTTSTRSFPIFEDEPPPPLPPSKHSHQEPSAPDFSAPSVENPQVPTLVRADEDILSGGDPTSSLHLSARPRSPSDGALYYSPSTESCRLQYITTRPPSVRTLRTSSSWASSSAGENLAPLAPPRKRLRRRQELRSQTSRTSDWSSYQSRPWTAHLSTIASESDRATRSFDASFSTFSLGSGVTTGESAPDSTAGSLLGPSSSSDNGSAELSPRRRRTVGSGSRSGNDSLAAVTLSEPGSEVSGPSPMRAKSAIPPPLFA
ncbi:hypothetical protein LTR66_015288, partial [Elasticomyces elasticus]